MSSVRLYLHRGLRYCLRTTYWNNIGGNCGHINTWYLLRLNLNVTVDAICHWHVQIKLWSSANAIYLLDWVVASVINNKNIRCNWCLLPILTLLTYAAMLCRWPFHKPACTRHQRSRFTPVCTRCWQKPVLPISAWKANYKYWLIFIYLQYWIFIYLAAICAATVYFLCVVVPDLLCS